MNLQPNPFAKASPSAPAVLVLFTTTFDGGTAIQRTLPGDLSFTLQIALVAHNDHGKVVLVFDAQDLLLKRCNFVEALTGCDRVDEQESFSCPHVLLSHGGVLFLTRSIEDIEQGDLIIDNALLAV